MMKKSILLLILPSIFWLTPGIAIANVNIQTDNVKVRVGNNQGVSVESSADYEDNDPWGWFPLRNVWPFESWFSKPTRRSSRRCETSHVSQETTSKDGVNYSHSSTSTQVCN